MSGDKKKISLGNININIDDALAGFKKTSEARINMQQDNVDRKPSFSVQKTMPTQPKHEDSSEAVQNVEEKKIEEKVEIRPQVQEAMEEKRSFRIKYQVEKIERKPEIKPVIVEKTEKIPEKKHFTKEVKVYKSKKQEHKDFQETVEIAKKVVQKKKEEMDIFSEDFVDESSFSGFKDYYGNEIKVKLESSMASDITSQQRRSRSRSPYSGFNNKKIVTKKTIILNQSDTVKDVSSKTGESIKSIVKKLREYDIEASDFSIIDTEVMHLIIEDFGHNVQEIIMNDNDVNEFEKYYNSGKLNEFEEKSPVVAIMGHVDHGKTTLLDTIRQANVASGEAGGITQSIGAYKVNVDGKQITFIDTPGHAAFQKIRQMGAKSTDIIVIIVAADDSIMPQTIESIKYAKSVNAPIIVAVNKIDAPGANFEKTKQDLMIYDILPEDFGGTVPVIGISALKKTNIDKLLDAILLQAEFMELRSQKSKFSKAIVVESKVDKNLGPVAHVIVKEGTIKVGDIICCQDVHGKIRIINDYNLKSIKTAGTSDPVQIIGLNGVAKTGEYLYSCDNEKKVKQFCQYIKDLKEQEARTERQTMTDDEVLKILSGEAQVKKKISVIIKCDTQGSADAFKFLISDITHEFVEVDLRYVEIGNVSDKDIEYAKLANARIFAFNVDFVNAKVKKETEDNKINFQKHNIIYRVIDEINENIKNILDPVEVEKNVGSANVRKVFNISKLGIIAGCVVASGKIQRNAFAKVFRTGKDEPIHIGKITSLKHQKEEIKEQTTGRECGIFIDGLVDLLENDRIVCFVKELKI